MEGETKIEYIDKKEERRREQRKIVTEKERIL